MGVERRVQSVGGRETWYASGKTDNDHADKIQMPTNSSALNTSSSSAAVR